MWTVSLCAIALALPQGAERGKGSTTQAPKSGQQKTQLQQGLWRARLRIAENLDLPFGLRLWRKNGEWRATIINGAERRHYPKLAVGEGTFKLLLPPYDSHLAARIVPGTSGRRLEGLWVKYRGGGKQVVLPFVAVWGRQARFAATAAASEKPASRSGRSGRSSDDANQDVAGRWAVQFAKDKHPAVGVFQVVKGDPSVGKTVHGTFLTTLGDYRFLAGTFHGNTLRLSCFDGAHAFLFRARMQANGTLRGHFWSSNTWHETWTAKRDSKARLPDAFRLTRWNQKVALKDLAYPDLTGRKRSLADPAFQGRARVLLVFGTWCPNCSDASRYLAELDKRYRGRGLRVLGLAFEHHANLKKTAPLVRAYKKHQGLEFPVLVAGISDKGAASKAFPALDRVRSYPTTIFLDRDGKVRAVHQGFSGPATGEVHRRLRQRFEEILEDLLGG